MPKPRILSYIECQECGRVYPRQYAVATCNECQAYCWTQWDPTLAPPMDRSRTLDILDSLVENALDDYDNASTESGGMYHDIKDAIIVLSQHFNDRAWLYTEPITEEKPDGQ